MELILIVFAVLVIGWEVSWRLKGVRPVGPSRLKRMLKDPEETKPLLVDVRTSAEFRLFHIEGAESHPDLILNAGSLNSSDTERPLVIICLSGHRSPVVGQNLKRRGFRNVYYLSWGMLAWIVSGGRVRR